MDKLASVIGGSHSGDIVSTSNIDIETVQRHEEEQLAKRIEEEAGEVKKRKCTPIEYLRLFNQVPRLDQVQVMKPKELTKEDAVRFIEAGCTRRRLADLYGMSVGKLYALLAEWGLHIPKKQLASEANKQECIQTSTQASSETSASEAISVPEASAETEIIWFPQPKVGEIMISKGNTIRINRIAVMAAPTQYHQGVRAKIGVHKEQDILIIQPAEEGYLFRFDKRALCCTSKQVVKHLQERGISIPAVFEATWQGYRWVGQLVKENQGQEAV